MPVTAFAAKVSDNAYDADGKYIYRSDTYDFPMLSDPQDLPDEQFFGKWDAVNEVWERPSYFKYDTDPDLYPEMEPVVAAVKEGDYELAKQELMDYYTPKKYKYNSTSASYNDKATYSCIIDEGSFVAVLSEESTISKIGLFWYNGSKRNEFFDLYVSPDGENWTEVFKGQSDGVTDGFEYVDVSSTDKYKYIRIDVHNNTGGTYNSLTEIKVYRGDSK